MGEVKGIVGIKDKLNTERLMSCATGIAFAGMSRDPSVMLWVYGSPAWAVNRHGIESPVLDAVSSWHWAVEHTPSILSYPDQQIQEL